MVRDGACYILLKLAKEYLDHGIKSRDVHHLLLEGKSSLA